MSRYDDQPHYVYRCFDAEGRLVYVGCTINVSQRIEQHRANSWWAPTVAKVTAKVYPNGPAGREAERAAIRGEIPRWNKSGKWAGRALWSQGDWHDWFVTLLREGISPALKRAFLDYQSLFGAPIPEDIQALCEEARAEKARRDVEHDAAILARKQQYAAMEAADLTALNAELTSLLARQEALARALGIDWDDPELSYPEEAIDEALRVRKNAAKGLDDA